MVSATRKNTEGCLMGSLTYCVVGRRGKLGKEWVEIGGEQRASEDTPDTGRNQSSNTR